MGIEYERSYSVTTKFFKDNGIQIELGFFNDKELHADILASMENLWGEVRHEYENIFAPFAEELHQRLANRGFIDSDEKDFVDDFKDTFMGFVGKDGLESVNDFLERNKEYLEKFK